MANPKNSNEYTGKVDSTQDLILGIFEILCPEGEVTVHEDGAVYFHDRALEELSLLATGMQALMWQEASFAGGRLPGTAYNVPSVLERCFKMPELALKLNLDLEEARRMKAVRHAVETRPI